MLVLILIQTAWHSDSDPERFFKFNFEKKKQTTRKAWKIVTDEVLKSTPKVLHLFCWCCSRPYDPPLITDHVLYMFDLHPRWATTRESILLNIMPTSKQRPSSASASALWVRAYLGPSCLPQHLVLHWMVGLSGTIEVITVLDCSRWYTITNTRFLTFNLDLGVKVTQNVARVPST